MRGFAWWTAALWACCAPIVAQAAVQGRVFDDANGNGVADPGERGVAGVAVSDGREVARTGADGRYALAARPGDIVFVVKPAGWNVPVRGGLPAYWHALPPDAPDAAEARVDFALQRATRTDRLLDVLVFADPQPKSAADVDYYRRDIVAPLGRPHAAFGLTLGDIVQDDPALYPGVVSATASLGVPWLYVAGNHDQDATASGDAGALQSFHRTFGPDTYAWEERQATFVLLDDVIRLPPGTRPAYIGGFREDQFAFLERYLATVPKDRLLVVGVHIPLFEAPGRDTFRDADRERLFALLRGFPHVLLLSAHLHTQQHAYHGAADGWHGAGPLHEYNVGAACGAYWSGVKDAQGIPDATMADGTPNGYATVRIDHDGVHALAWHPARLAAGDPASTRAMSVHAPKVLRRGAYPAWGVYANVYMGEDDTRVEYRVDGGDWKPMARIDAPDPRLLAENVRDDEAGALRGYDRSPEAEPSPHLWRGALPTSLAAGDHRVEVRTFDRWQGEQRAGTTYRLAEAEE